MSENKCCCVCGSFSPMTHIAGMFGILFVLFMFFEATTIRWWLMLPLGLASYVLFYIQRGQTDGIEKKVCSWGGWIVLGALILRDMCLSGQLVAAYQRLTAAGIPLHG